MLLKIERNALVQTVWLVRLAHQATFFHQVCEIFQKQPLKVHKLQPLKVLKQRLKLSKLLVRLQLQP